jgi:hypothetical protein
MRIKEKFGFLKVALKLIRKAVMWNGDCLSSYLDAIRPIFRLL